ncbi:hypothetical protein ACFYM2_05110 [Streptomyces sp. NPDC006711]|uniref:hypothetical protein n=1 Tax=unclassified Streptomyces TaxID=2593676 RepID=UPI00340B26E9
MALRAAEQAGLDFGWREVEGQDGQGVVVDGTGRPLWEGAVHPQDGYAPCRQGPGRVLRELAVWHATLSRLDPSEDADRAILHRTTRARAAGRARTPPEPDHERARGLGVRPAAR